ncbi:ABC transporter ATP-binding protein [Nonomuraea sp. SBT364]|uniref:ABC transporter ATP-binding protein n=1 Tax=Nonomuraea sp. SBT364 TaxID=1580530 RepID=UPI001E4262FD|nr:ATP-binding cassette domain-containing protein [Nonomuraea sp. SBT364]
MVTKAVDGVSMTVGPGEMVGYLGPNGAGKSTTIKMLTGVLVPTSGRVEVNGLVPWRDRRANARAIGVVFGQRTQLWQDLPLRDSFELVAKLYGMGRNRYLSRLAAFTDLLDLGPFIDTPVRSLSLGQRMRGDLAAAMLHEPPLLYLDEPTVGLDVVAKARIRDFIANLNADTGTTVILTTHDIADVERLCRRAVIIDEGRVAYDGDLDALRRRYLPYRELAVIVQPPLPEWDIPGVELVDTVAHHGHVILNVRHDPLMLSTPEAIGRITARVAVVDLTVKEPDLEQVIHRIYTAR